MQHWQQYDKIPYSLATSSASKKPSNRKESEGLWIVTEKIHGANFSVSYDGEQSHYAKRRAPLSMDESFYQFQRIVPRLQACIESLWSLCRSRNQDETGLILQS